MDYLTFFILFVTSLVLIPSNGVDEKVMPLISKLLLQVNELEERMKMHESIIKDQELAILRLVEEKTDCFKIPVKCNETETNGIQQRATSGGGVAFNAYMGQSMENPVAGQAIIFYKVVTNIGGHYNKQTGIFTSPDNGVYVFSWTIYCEPNGYIYTDLVVNSRPYGQMQCKAGISRNSITGVTVAAIKQGDVVFVSTEWYKGRIESFSNVRSSFSGWKIF
ncbi:collagen alpha-1(VIII) chain-like [Saccostrea cucullata]|uniref:collagen alpha-1(VIII) chain-like n=1 Tax=Saccostrea cuccullata TaxID=36930 RepID=UPI002ED3B07C